LFLNFTNENGIMTRLAWQLMNKFEMFKEHQKDSSIKATNIKY